MKRTFFCFLSLCLILFLSLSLITAILFTSWGQDKLTRYLHSKGITQFSGHLQTYSATHLQADHLSTTLALREGPLQIALKQIRLEYRLPTLLQGQVAGALIKEVRILLPPAGKSQSQLSLDLQRMLDLLAKLHLPLERLTIEKLQILRAPNAQPLLPELRVQLSNNQGQPTLRIKPTTTSSSAPFLEAALTGQIWTARCQADLALMRPFFPKALNQSHGMLKAELALDLTPQASPAFTLESQVRGLQIADITMGRLQLHLEADPDPKQNRILLGPGSSGQLNNFQYATITLGTASLNLAGSLQLENNQPHLSLQPVSPWQAKGLQIASLSFRPLTWRQQALIIRLNSETFNLVGEIAQVDRPGQMDLHVTQHLTTNGRGELSLTSKHPIAMDKQSNLPRLFRQPSLPIQLENGLLDFSLAGHWQPRKPFSLKGFFNLNQAKGMLVNHLFSGGSLHQELTFLPQFTSIQPGKIHIDQLEGATTLEQTRLTTTFEPSSHGSLPRLVINKGSTKLFDGRAQTGPCSYDFNRPTSQCVLRLDGLNLPELLTIQKIKGLTTTGRIKGTLPLLLGKQGVRIHDGLLTNSTGGGVIRYQPPAGALEASPLPAYALKALENFHYNKLAAQVGYEPSGTLVVNLQLQGNSPELEKGRPVHLNVNTEQNLLSLLKSLQYSQQLTDKLDKKIQYQGQRLHLK